MQESHTDLSRTEDITLSKKWQKEQTERFIAWELLCRYLRGDHMVPMRSLNLCDRIGVSKTYVTTLIRSVREKLNPEDNAE
jgi:hypothetical protein